MLDAAGEAFRPHRHLDAARRGLVVRQKPHGHDAALAPAALLHRPQPAVEQAFLAVVAQAYQLVAGRRYRLCEAAPLAHPHVVGAPRGVAADQNLVGVEHALWIEIGLAHDFALAIAAGLEIVAGADVHRQPNDRIARGLPMHLGQHRVRLGLGEKAAALDRRQLRRVAQHQERHAERQQVAAQFGIDHRAFVDDDQLGLGSGRLVPQIEVRHLLATLARAVNERMDGGGAVAALAAHYGCRLAGEGGELHLAVDMLGEMAGERGLAGAGIAKQAEHLARVAVRTRLILQPGGDRLQRGVLMGGELRHGADQ